MVMLTSTRNGTEFAYKDMDETCGPCAYDCPESILKLLSPTDSQWANEWREKCRAKAARVKILKKASVIKLTFDFDTRFNNQGDTVYLKKNSKNHWIPVIFSDIHKQWVTCGGWYMRNSLVMQNIYEIVE